MVASPFDVAPERAAAEQVVRKLNLTICRIFNTRLELIRWETDTWPDFGLDAQDVINAQLPNDFDCFIGILWGRFGTPTGRYGSGTEEEFDRVLARRRRGDAVNVMMYFKDAPLKPNEIDLEQLGRVRNFRSCVEAEGGYHFSFVDRFDELLELHLTLQLIARHVPEGIVQVAGQQATATDPPLVRLNGTADTNSDRYSKATSHLKNVARVIKEIGGSMDELATRLATHTERLNAPECHGNRSRIDDVMNEIARDIFDFLALIEAAIPAYATEFESGVDAFLDALTTISARIRSASRRTVTVLDRFVSELAASQSLLNELNAALACHVS
jgi:hypothetical protein